ncbi:MAG: PAS domain-containing protein, partial [Vicinamibacteria bacterium]|nr:PAS domain-containing protein [Vicinamibacteria bacterium]
RLRFEHLTMDQGLSNNFIHSILKDSRGFLWFGTAEGLNRYDGSTPLTTVYKHDPADPGSLPAFSASVLYEDSHKRMWVGSGWVQGGFAFFDRDRERFMRIMPNPGQNGGNQVRSILEDRQGGLWVGTDNGLVEVDPEQQKIKRRYPLGPEETSGSATKVVRSLYEDRGNRLWAGTDSGLLSFDRQRGEYIPWAGAGDDATGLESAEIWDFYEDESGALWIATKSGLHCLDPESGRVTRYLPNPNDPNSISHAAVTQLAADGRGRLYVGTEGGGLNILDLRTRKFNSIRPDPEDAAGLNSASIWSLMRDDQDILWIGTYDGGVNILSPLNQRFAHIRGRRGEMSDPHVSAVMEDHLGHLWIGTDTGLNRLDRRTGAYRYYLDIPGVWTLLEDSEHNLWIGTYGGGVGLLDPETGRVTPFRHDPIRPTSLQNDKVWRIIELGTGELLVVTAGGVDLFDRKARIFTRLSQRYSDATIDVVFAAAEDHDGNLWLVGNPVVYVDRKAGRSTRYQNDPENPSSVPAGQTFTVFIDSAGNAWLGVEGGLTCIAAGTRRIRRFTTADGLPHNCVNNIIEDATGSLWLTTYRGLSKFIDAVKLPDKPRFLNFGPADGLQGHRFTRNANHRSASGEIFFGGPRGLNIFRPERILRNLKPPMVVLTGIRLFDQSLKVGVEGSPLTTPLAKTNELVLSHEQSMLTFEYAALNYLLPEKNQYQWKLEGFDAGWRPVSADRTATYTNLNPRKYVFHVKAANNDGVWNDKGVSLRIRVTPPWWWAPWSKVMYVLLAAGFVVGTVRWRLSAVEARRRELEMLVEQRTTDLHGEIAQHRATEARLAGEVSERKRAEEAAHEYAEKLAGSNLELMEGQRALKEKQDALERENEERRRAEQAAGRERDLLHALMDNIPDLIYFKDTRGRFIRVNAALARTLGVARVDEALGKSDQDFFPASYAHASLREEQELLNSGRPLLGKLERHDRDGRWYLATKVPLRNADGEIDGLVGISRDITDRREAEEKLARNLAAFQETVNAVAKGDLTRKGLEGDDTVGRIARSVNAMIAGFAEILAEVHDTAFSVSTASSEILAAATEIAKGAEFGSDHVHSTSSAVEEMAASMTQVSRNAGSSADKARQVLDYVQQGDRAVDATYLGMTRIDEAVSQTAQKMRMLEQSSREIFKIIDLIEEIASQSRLLALNAAIEAAHAGDAG